MLNYKRRKNYANAAAFAMVMWPISVLVEFSTNPSSANSFVLEMSSALYVCCIYLNALQTTFDLGCTHYEARSEQSGMDPYCLQEHKQMTEQMT